MTETVLYKVGGSLLSLEELGARICRLLGTRGDHRALLVAGGGETADLVRRWDRLHGLGEDRAHWLALRCLSLNEVLLLELLPGGRSIARRNQAEAVWMAGGVPVVNADAFLRDEEPWAESRLPHTWDVSSDSIAAWIALRWPAEELVLLKSCDLPEDCRVAHAVESQLVDRYFLQLAPALPRITWCNLRADPPRLQCWTGC